MKKHKKQPLMTFRQQKTMRWDRENSILSMLHRKEVTRAGTNRLQAEKENVCFFHSREHRERQTFVYGTLRLYFLGRD